MTPYEVSLRKKLTQATELMYALTKWREKAGYKSVSEELILQTLIQQIEITNQQFDDQLQHYLNLSDKRRQLATGSDDCIKALTDQLWEDIGYQFRPGTVANDLLKILCQKIHRFPIPDFPISRRNPLDYKTVRLYEDSFALVGQYFGWLVDLLKIISFTPIRSPYCLDELRNWVRHYNTLTRQVRQEAELLKDQQLIKNQLYKQLNKTTRVTKGRLVVYKREASLSTE